MGLRRALRVPVVCRAGVVLVAGVLPCVLRVFARAVRLLADMQHLRHEDGSYWTGYVYPDEVRWPGEQTTYTAANLTMPSCQSSRRSDISPIEKNVRTKNS